MASWKVEICLKKKNPPRAQIFRYFRIESRNNKNFAERDENVVRLENFMLLVLFISLIYSDM